MVMPDSIRAFLSLHKAFFQRKKMDCRVEPGNDLKPGHDLGEIGARPILARL
jgi:hypothetical protein